MIGLPGSGKSLFGARLAECLKVSFVDTDLLIEATTGLFIPEIFARYGEASFRDTETLALERAIQQGNTVIATGGGMVLREENRKNLRENCTVIYLKRTCKDILESAEMEHRPLLAHNPGHLNTLYEERHALYEECAHTAVENNADEETVLKRLRKAVESCGF